MRKMNNGKKLPAVLLALAMLLSSFPAVLAEDVTAEIPVEDAAVELLQDSAEETLPEPESVIPEEEPAAEPEAEAIPEEEPEAGQIPEEEPAVEPEAEALPEEEFAEVPEDVLEEEQGTEPAGEDECADGDPAWFDDDDAGSVCEELTEEFNNPETYETSEFSGSVEIEMKNSEIHFGGDVTLAARVSGTEKNHRIVWEANDGDGRGWFTVGSGPEYTFTVTRDVVDREYRVNLFTVD